MKIVFFSSSIVPVYPRITEERALGGTESALVFLAQALYDRGHQVYVMTPHHNPAISSPLYINNRLINQLKSCDVLVAVRDWQVLVSEINTKFRFFWTGDDIDLLQTVGIGDRRVAGKIDAVLCASNWHADRLTNASGFDSAKTFALAHAVKKSHFFGSEPRSKHRLVYTSTPYRGLSELIKIFPRIRQKYESAELHIFSSMDVYQGAPGYEQNANQKFHALFEQLKQIDGCFLRGSLTKNRLARELMQASILAYPNTFLETGCISALEAKAAGCVPITTKAGALPETVADAGILIEGDASSEKYHDDFINAVFRLFEDQELFTTLSMHAQNTSRDWSDVAVEFEEIVSKC